MKINPNTYSWIEPVLKRIIDEDLKEQKSIQDIVSRCVSATSVPVIAVVDWIRYLYGNLEGLDSIRQKLILFYGYTGITPIAYKKEE